MLQTNCLTEVLFDEALARAAYLDKYQAEHDGKVIGPLHGLPISLKDQFPTPPHPSSLGIALLATIPATSEMPLLTILRVMGAVFYVKTNVPTALMMPPCPGTQQTYLINDIAPVKSPFAIFSKPSFFCSSASTYVVYHFLPVAFSRDAST